MNENYSAIGIRYHSLNSNDNNLLLRYIWLEGIGLYSTGRLLRTKSTRAIVEPKTVDEVPLWSYCGYSCGHMKAVTNSEAVLKPVLLLNDPFRQHRNRLVFCVPTKCEIQSSIHRNFCEEVFNKLNESKTPEFTIRQPYFLVNPYTKRPIGWPVHDFDVQEKTSNYGVGSNIAVGRDINEAFYRACLYAGLPLSSTQAEDIPSMWSFDLGPTHGLAIADQLWMARYILDQISEEFKIEISLDPLKQIHTNNQCMKIWTEGQSSHKTFAMNSDPYIALKAIADTL